MYNVVFDESFYSELGYTSQPHAEAMAMLPAVSYIPYTTYPREQTGNINTLAQFKEGNLLSGTHNDTESGNKSYENSTVAPLISEEEMDLRSSDTESDDEPMSTDMLEDIHGRSQSHSSIIEERQTMERSVIINTKHG